MNRPSDETLMAYADDALVGTERASVEAYLVNDADARKLVETFRKTRMVARAAFDDAVISAPPAALVDRILSAPAPARSAAKLPEDDLTDHGNIVPIGRSLQKAGPGRTWRPKALAASLALLIGVVAGYLAGRSGPGPLAVTGVALGPVATQSALARVLDREPGGATVDRIAIVATFRDRQERACREFEVLESGAAGARALSAAIACRTPDGSWSIEGAARIAAATPPGAGFQPSGSPERDVLDGLLNMLGASTVLTPDQERQLMARGWR
jgi:hypothetical protein